MVTTNCSKRIFHDAYHYRTGAFHEVRSGGRLHQGTDYGTTGKNLPQFSPFDQGVVIRTVNKETNGDARGCRVEIHYPKYNVGMVLQHMVEGSVKVKPGEIVSKGTELGLTGMTGKYSNGTRVSTGVHAHVEVYYLDQGSSATFNFESIDADKIDPEEEEMTYEKFVEFMDKYLAEQAKKPQDSWSKTEGYFDKASAAKIMDGTAPLSALKREELAAVLGRLGLIK